MRNYPEWIMVFSAVTSIGGVAVAMNALWQPEEMAYGLQDSGAKVLLADQERLLKRFEAPLEDSQPEDSPVPEPGLLERLRGWLDEHFAVGTVSGWATVAAAAAPEAPTEPPPAPDPEPEPEADGPDAPASFRTRLRAWWNGVDPQDAEATAE